MVNRMYKQYSTVFSSQFWADLSLNCHQGLMTERRQKTVWFYLYLILTEDVHKPKQWREWKRNTGTELSQMTPSDLNSQHMLHDIIEK